MDPQAYWIFRFQTPWAKQSLNSCSKLPKFKFHGHAPKDRTVSIRTSVFWAGSLEFGNLKFEPFKTKLRTSEPDTLPKSPNIIRVKTNSVTIFQPAQSYFPIPAILQRYKLYLWSYSWNEIPLKKAERLFGLWWTM